MCCIGLPLFIIYTYHVRATDSAPSPSYCWSWRPCRLIKSMLSFVTVASPVSPLFFWFNFQCEKKSKKYFCVIFFASKFLRYQLFVMQLHLNSRERRITNGSKHKKKLKSPSFFSLLFIIAINISDAYTTFFPRLFHQNQMKKLVQKWRVFSRPIEYDLCATLNSQFDIRLLSHR